MKRNIIFVGSMASGKSHIGRNLAAKLGWQFVDTDRYLEREYNRPIAKIYQELGEREFREKEKELLARVSKYHEAVISFGGNFPLSRETIRRLRYNSVVICLRASKMRLIKRVMKRVGKRPTMDYEDVHGFVRGMVNKWRNVYRSCDYVLDTTFGESELLVVEVLDFLEKKNVRFKKRATIW